MSLIALGVSKELVSFALNDRPGVSPETRQRILDAVARDLGWKPDAKARALGSGRSLAYGDGAQPQSECGEARTRSSRSPSSPASSVRCPTSGACSC